MTFLRHDRQRGGNNDCAKIENGFERVHKRIIPVLVVFDWNDIMPILLIGKEKNGLRRSNSSRKLFGKWKKNNLDA
jgi:hypothetical protein